MHIGLIRLLKRGMSCSLLKQFWGPPLLCQGGEHGVAKNMRSDRNASPRSESPKERVYVCIGKCLAGSGSMSFDEQMIRLHLRRVFNPNVGHNFVNEVC